MKIQTNQILKDFSDKPIKLNDHDDENLTLGKAIAQILIHPRVDKKMDIVKSYVLAGKFYKENEVEIDEADFSNLIETIKLGDLYSPLISGQIIILLNEINK